ncbi:MAG: M24 family metallopeptidase [Acidimicrobiales bacterium]
MSTLVPCDIAARSNRLGVVLSDLECEALLVTDLTNIAYLTGFSGSSATLLVTADEMCLATDGRYGHQAPAELAAAGSSAATVVGSLAEQADALVERVMAAGVTKLGLESEHITWADQQMWADVFAGAAGASRVVVPTSGVVGGLRAIKDGGEVARIEAAASIADAALADVLDLLATGITERAFALALDHRMLERGAQALSFETICAAGPNSALPHATPSERPIGAGELVVLDFGAVVDGYHSDMTRTFHMGEPSPEAAAMLTLVLDAQELGVRSVGVGVACSAVDAACREHISAAGLAGEFVHGTGHGVGRVIHEAPWINGRNPAPLVAGQVVTVEPGVYRPGFGGVRIEDTVLVAADGARRLTGFPKDPVLAL